MGQAREVMDRLTAAVMAKDMEAAAECYAEDAVAETPDAGTLRGREAIVDWHRAFVVAFPDARYEPYRKMETDDTAIDAGAMVGVHTGPLEMPTGETLGPTGKEVRIRECDFAVVRDGRIVEWLRVGDAPPGSVEV